MPPKLYQTKLFSKERVTEPAPSVLKKRSKKFDPSETTGIPEVSTSTHRWKYGTGHTPKTLSISCWNVNGIRSVISKGNLQEYIGEKNPDILCLNETKINEKAFLASPIEFPYYNGYWNFCKVSAGYSGVAVFSKYLPISCTEDLEEKQHSLEGRVLTLEFFNFYLVVVYVPNSGSQLVRLKYRIEFDMALQKHCNQLSLKKPTLICGDMNVCHQDIDLWDIDKNRGYSGTTKDERDSFSNFLGQGWIDTFRYINPEGKKYSWWNQRTLARDRDQGWRLDYFLCDLKMQKYVKWSGINNQIFGSDHCPIELNLRFD